MEKQEEEKQEEEEEEKEKILEEESAVVPTPTTNVTDAATSQTPIENVNGLHFIGPSHAVKDLFSVPYSGAFSVAVHNIDGTLLIDAAADPLDSTSAVQVQQQFSKQAQEQQPSSPPLFVAPHDSSTTQLIALPDKQQNDAVALIETILQKQQTMAMASPTIYNEHETQDDKNDGSSILADDPPNILKLPPPEKYSESTVGLLPHEPREYLPWKFQNNNLLVGSDAWVYRAPAAAPETNNVQQTENATTSTALTVRVADATQLKLQLERHQQQAEAQNSFASETTYADVLAARNETSSSAPPPSHEPTLASPDSIMLRLQSCVVPAPGTSVLGGGGGPSVPLSQQPTSTSSLPSPVCTVLDAYLDNIIANVPQLALCLYEKGFIQSVKLLQTQDIPSTLLHPSTLDVSSPVVVLPPESGSQQQPLFSPQVMEMNASMLLRFLRSHCTRDNATYLLSRQEGQSNVELYDISSVSAQRQRKWIWWLAIMSFRFAARLKQLSLERHFDASQKRSFRARQRALLMNCLELLQDLKDRDGPAHETFCAAVCENLADTFLTRTTVTSTNENEKESDSNAATRQQPPTLSSHPYDGVSGDALNKALDHLVNGIKTLRPVLERNQEEAKKRQQKRKARRRGRTKTNSINRQHVVVVHRDGSSSSSSSSGSEDEDEDKTDHAASPLSMEEEAATMQLFGLHHKLINVYLRLAEHHLHNYWSSSAMQSLRTAARRIADAMALVRPLAADCNLGETDRNDDDDDDKTRLQQSLRFQYGWLWEHCGFFARSFAADELWRDRGHCCGDDIISLLRDVEAAFASLAEDTNDNASCWWLQADAPIAKKTAKQVSLHSLSAIVANVDDDHGEVDVARSMANNTPENKAAKAVLEQQKMIKRDERRVLVAACVSYSLAIGAFQDGSSNHSTQRHAGNHNVGNDGTHCTSELMGPLQDEPTTTADSSILAVLRQRLGDACNEIGKILLHELRTVLTEPESNTGTEHSSRDAAGPLLSSAEFWFREGLFRFDECKDLRNIALLRCNLCQCCKLRANNMFLTQPNNNRKGSTHAETCLQDAADHLQMAHETLGQRDVDPVTWDMVSDELAATFLVLGVRRRQSFLGGGTTPLIVQAMRLNPGKERMIVDPMTRALNIYEQSGNAHQAAAAHYQLALFYSKVWTCQRDETKTREKLSAAFQHYAAAHAYFSGAQRGQEPTFCILCLDLSNLYSAVSGQECVAKALDRCLDTSEAFSSDAVNAEIARTGSASGEWFDKMATLASSIEERVFKLLLSLVKLEKESDSSDTKYKDLYRVGLTAKATRKKTDDNGSVESRFIGVHDLLSTIKKEKNRLSSEIA